MIYRIIVAAIVGSIFFIFFEFLFWGVLLRDFFSTSRIEYPGLIKTPLDFVSLMLFNLVWAAMLAFIFEKWAGIRTFAAGALAGAVFMSVVELAINLRDVALFNLLRNPAVVIPVKLITIAITGAAGGGAMAVVLGKMRK
jgi:hypothetical protein